MVFQYKTRRYLVEIDHKEDKLSPYGKSSATFSETNTPLKIQVVSYREITTEDLLEKLKEKVAEKFIYASKVDKESVLDVIDSAIQKVNKKPSSEVEGDKK